MAAAQLICSVIGLLIFGLGALLVGVPVLSGILGALAALMLLSIIASIRNLSEPIREEEAWYDGASSFARYTLDQEGDVDTEGITTLHFITRDGQELTCDAFGMLGLAWADQKPGWVILQVGERTRAIYDIRLHPSPDALGGRPGADGGEYRFATETAKSGGLIKTLLMTVLGGLFSALPLIVWRIMALPAAELAVPAVMTAPFALLGLYLFLTGLLRAWGLARYFTRGPLQLAGVLAACQDLRPGAHPADRRIPVRLTVEAGGRRHVLNGLRTFPWQEFVGRTLHLTVLPGTREVLTMRAE